MRAVTGLVLGLTLLACSTGHDPAAIERELADAKRAYASKLKIEAVRDLKAKSLPLRIAIAPPTRGGYPWSEQDRAALQSLEEPLRKAGIATDLVILSDAIRAPCGDDWRDACRLEEVRATALRARTDAVLILYVASDVDEYASAGSLSYLAIAPMWFVDATHRDALTVVDGVLLDADSEYLYAFARGQAEIKRATPLVYADSQQVLAESRAVALAEFAKQLIEKTRELRPSSVTKRDLDPRRLARPD